MTTVIGIDPSSVKLAAVVSVVGGESSAEVYVKKLPTDKPEACLQAMDWAHALVKMQGLDDVVVYIEYPVMGRGGPGSTIPQALINGALQAGAHKAGAKVYSVNNAHCKKVVIGKGNATKDEIAAWVKKAWPGIVELIAVEHARDQDLFDSAMIYIYGKRDVERRARSEARKQAGGRVVRRRTVKGR